MADRLSFAYKPPGATLRAFRASNAFARALIGPMEGGRKTCVVHDIVLRAGLGTQRRWRWIVLRPDSTALEEHTIATWHRWVPADLGEWDAKALRHRIDFAAGGKERDLEIQFLAWDRPEHRRRLSAAEATGFWLDDARGLDEVALDLALDHAGTWPLDEEAAGLVTCTSRMPPADHWLVRRFPADGETARLFRQPGGRSPQAENIRKPGHYQRISAGRSAEWVRVHVDAEFGEAPTATGAAQTLRNIAKRGPAAELSDLELARRIAWLANRPTTAAAEAA